eukprot:303970-Prymnesium_polylepis.1
MASTAPLPTYSPRDASTRPASRRLRSGVRNHCTNHRIDYTNHCTNHCTNHSHALSLPRAITPTPYHSHAITFGAITFGAITSHMRVVSVRPPSIFGRPHAALVGRRPQGVEVHCPGTRHTHPNRTRRPRLLA